MQMIAAHEKNSRPVKQPFTTRQLFAGMILIAVPLGFFSTYWASVNNTVDERTVPFANAGGSARWFLYASAISLGLSIATALAWLCWRRHFKTAFIASVIVLLCGYLGSAWVQSKIIDPVHGNPEAETNCHAAQIAAMAILRYVERTGRWPESWDTFHEDTLSVLSELTDAHERFGKNPDPFAAPRELDSYWGDEASQSISAQAPDIHMITLDSLPNLVKIDFSADPRKLAKQKWYEFQGITPKKPSYNVYRVEFQKLIQSLSDKSFSEQPK